MMGQCHWFLNFDVRDADRVLLKFDFASKYCLQICGAQARQDSGVERRKLLSAEGSRAEDDDGDKGDAIMDEQESGSEMRVGTTRRRPSTTTRRQRERRDPALAPWSRSEYATVDGEQGTQTRFEASLAIGGYFSYSLSESSSLALTGELSMSVASRSYDDPLIPASRDCDVVTVT